MVHFTGPHHTSVRTSACIVALSAFLGLAMSPFPALAHESGNSTGMPMTGDADHDFAMMMRKHHQDGIQMAEKELANGKDPAMKRMAQNIVDAQTKEVTEFDQWLSAHKSNGTGSK